MALFRTLGFLRPLSQTPQTATRKLISVFLARQFKTISSLRNVPSHKGGFFKVTKKGSERLKLKDNISQDYSLIYKAPMELTLRVAYPTVLLSTLGAPAFLAYQYFKTGKIILSRELKSLKYLNPELQIWCFFAGLVVVALAGFSVMFKFPFRIYKHNLKQEYIAIFLSAVPLKLHHFHFKGACLTKFKNPLYSFLGEHHYLIDKKRTFLLPHYFRVPRDFCDMLSHSRQVKY